MQEIIVKLWLNSGDYLSCVYALKAIHLADTGNVVSGARHFL